jgi:phage host-nuclease inhibitor protein Gam
MKAELTRLEAELERASQDAEKAIARRINLRKDVSDLRRSVHHLETVMGAKVGAILGSVEKSDA